MGNRQKPNTTKKIKPEGESVPPEGAERRDPAEVRAEVFRVAAQRETVEAFVVAFILALLFRAFLAEAFVIPTGSMAPALMGAHKDLVCEQCGTSFQFGASRERNGNEANLVVVAGVCPNCRYVNPLDLANNNNHVTFNGDRILVSKFAYTLSDPERWDVIVFKYPGNPKQNYIKRLVGLPNETLTIRHGDVFARRTGSNDPDVILRKPADTLLAMRHPVDNSDHQATTLINANYPSRWQPWIEKATEPPQDSWQIERGEDGLTAKLKADDRQFKWLRYFHRWPSDKQWKQAMQGESLADVDPYSSRAITDFYTYDSYVHVPAGYVYKTRPSMQRGTRWERLLNGGYSQGTFAPNYRSGENPEQFGRASEWGGQDDGMQQLGRDGFHWVGDLIFEVDLETTTASTEAILELVEAGIKYRCRIDLKTGKAVFQIDDVDTHSFDSLSGQPNREPSAQTSIRAGSRSTLRFSNCDDELLLWVDGNLVTFDAPTTFNSLEMRSDADNHPQFLDATHPLDAAPVGVAVLGGEATIRSLRIDRDQYYIATQDSDAAMSDYDMNELWKLNGGRGVTLKQIQQVLATPTMWSEFVGWGTRRRVTFELQDDQFFPMGDNSPESLDARCWAGSRSPFALPREVNKDAWIWHDKSYVPRDLLVGKALVVFWPHSWNEPVPFLPNVKRMKLIR